MITILTTKKKQSLGALIKRFAILSNKLGCAVIEDDELTGKPLFGEWVNLQIQLEQEYGISLEGVDDIRKYATI